MLILYVTLASLLLVRAVTKLASYLSAGSRRFS